MHLIHLLHVQLVLRLQRGRRDERGDIPGWVLVTVMTIAIGMGLWTIAEDRLGQMLENALNSVR